MTTSNCSYCGSSWPQYATACPNCGRVTRAQPKRFLRVKPKPPSQAQPKPATETQPDQSTETQTKQEAKGQKKKNSGCWGCLALIGLGFFMVIVADVIRDDFYKSESIRNDSNDSNVVASIPRGGNTANESFSKARRELLAEDSISLELMAKAQPLEVMFLDPDPEGSIPLVLPPGTEFSGRRSHDIPGLGRRDIIFIRPVDGGRFEKKLNSSENGPGSSIPEGDRAAGR